MIFNNKIIQSWPQALKIFGQTFLGIVLSLTLYGCIEATATHPPYMELADNAAQVDSDAAEIDTESKLVVTGFRDITAGDDFNCAIHRATGMLFCWGRNDEGQTGRASSVDLGLPGQASTFTDWSQVQAGDRHACGIRAKEITEKQDDGSFKLLRIENQLWCWGTNKQGQTGYARIDNTTGLLSPTLKRSPVRVGKLTDWDSTYNGGQHGCALRYKEDDDEQSLYCWGRNDYGQYGDGSTETLTFLAPKLVATNTDWKTLSLGENHSCGIKNDNSLWCWGQSIFHQLGVEGGDTTVPQQVAQVGDDTDRWLSVSASAQHTCALRDDHTLWCWGFNTYGQLGQVTTGSIPEPSKIPVVIRTSQLAPPDNDWKQVSSGGSHTCALKNSGDVWCWGNNTYGQTGQPEVGNQTLPAYINSQTTFREISVGRNHSCAINIEFQVYCWGLNIEGQLGIDSVSPINIISPTNNFAWAQISSGHDYTCGIQTNKSLWCGGMNAFGQLGDGTPLNRPKPVEIKTNGRQEWLLVKTGLNHTCAIRDNLERTLWCWGNNQHNKLGPTNATMDYDHWAPLQVVAENAPNAQWAGLSLGIHHSCALKSDPTGYTPWCWGSNNFGQLGLGKLGDGTGGSGDIQPIIQPEQVKPYTDWERLSAGGYHTCGIRETNILPLQRELYCWGRNDFGQLGTGTTTDELSPVLIGTYKDWISVSSGANHTCGIRKTNTQPIESMLYCWGKNGFGQLGLNNILDQHEPTLVGEATNWTHVYAGLNNNTCGLRTDDRGATYTLYCWGFNRSNQTSTSHQEAITEPGSWGRRTWSNITLGSASTCALNSGQMHCWGEGTPYQLGKGNAWYYTPQSNQ